jgi:hypothetical protein
MTRSLWIPIIVHFLNNGWAVLGAVVMASGAASTDGPSDTTALLIIAGVAVAVLAASSVGLYLLRVRDAEPVRE